MTSVGGGGDAGGNARDKAGEVCSQCSLLRSCTPLERRIRILCTRSIFVKCLVSFPTTHMHSVCARTHSPLRCTCAHSVTRLVGGCIARCGGRSAYFARAQARAFRVQWTSQTPVLVARNVLQDSTACCNTCRDALRAFGCAADETRITRALTGAPLRVLDNKWIRYSPAVPSSTHLVPEHVCVTTTDHCRQVLR